MSKKSNIINAPITNLSFGRGCGWVVTLMLCILPLTACSHTTMSVGSAAADSSATAEQDSLPNNGRCVTLRMNDGTQQLIYLRTHPAVKHLPRQTQVSTMLTVITYNQGDVVRYQQGKALLAGTSTKGLPASAKSASTLNEQILFFGLPRNSHITIVTDSDLQWRDEDIEGSTYALSLTELPRGSYLVTVNSTTFRVELK